MSLGSTWSSVFKYSVRGESQGYCLSSQECLSMSSGIEKA